MDARRRIAYLRAEIIRHNFAYYVLDMPEVTDSTYDTLMRELTALEEANPDLLTWDSPTQSVGYPCATG